MGSIWYDGRELENIERTAVVEILTTAKAAAELGRHLLLTLGSGTVILVGPGIPISGTPGGRGADVNELVKEIGPRMAAEVKAKVTAETEADPT